MYHNIIYEKSLLKEEKDVITTTNMYQFWKDFLFGKIIRIFKWKGLPFPQREMEMRLLLNGFSGIANDKIAGKICVNGSLSGVTPYPDIFTTWVYAAPKSSGGQFKINTKDCVVIYNTSLMQTFIPFIERYASLLAHIDVTLKCALVNMRYTDTFNAHSGAEKDSIKAWYNDIYKGGCGVIVSDMLIDENTVQQISNTTNQLSLREIVEARNDILRDFFCNIGIRYIRDKKANMVVEEISGDSQFLLFNIHDMLEQRKEGAKNLQNLMDIPAEVELSEEYKIIEQERGNFNEENNNY